MSTDLRVRIDQFFKAEKTLEGSGDWYLSERIGLYKFQRLITEDGVSYGFKLEINAHVDTSPREFRFMVSGFGACVCRLDCAPVTDGTHINGEKRPFGFPYGVEGNHFHPWPENRVFSTASELSKKLPYALESNGRISTIEQGFWHFCSLVGISASNDDEPDWPKPGKFI
jgi:hypothetical protein